MSDAPAPPDPPGCPQTGALMVTGAVLALFGFTIVASAFGMSVAEGPARLLETALTLVIGYWLGSSAGSRAKDALMGMIRR